MNVIVSNKYTQLLKTLDIEVIKTLEGIYDADDIVNTFSNFYFNKMILDITAINGYDDINNLQKIAIALDTDKIILMLDNDNTIINNIYLSKLVSIGFYNFSRNLENIKYLFDHPNSYRDVAHIQTLEVFPSSSYSPDFEGSGTKIIGFKNLTEHAGSTSLIYIVKKMLSGNFNVKALEIDKRDFTYLPQDVDMISASSENAPKAILSSKDADILLIDLNNFEDDSICNDVIYLIDPGLIKVNKMMRRDIHVFEKHKGKKIVLNRSALSEDEIKNFEYEAKTNFFFNIPNIEMRTEENEYVLRFLNKLGLLSLNE